MGTEIYKPTPPREETGRKLSGARKFVFGSLAALVVIVPAVLDGCSKKPHPLPPTPVGTTGKAPQFPQGNDRPLQDQQKKEVPTTTPTLKKEPPTLKKENAPQPQIEAGWKQIEIKAEGMTHYSVKYPSNWTVQEWASTFEEENILGYKVKMSVHSGITPKQTSDAFKENVIAASSYTPTEVSVVQLGGYGAWKITTIIPVGSFGNLTNADLVNIEYVFVTTDFGQGLKHGWQVNFFFPAPVQSRVLPIVNDIMSSFKPLN